MSAKLEPTVHRMPIMTFLSGTIGSHYTINAITASITRDVVHTYDYLHKLGLKCGHRFRVNDKIKLLNTMERLHGMSVKIGFSCSQHYNPFIYCWLNKDFKQRVKRLFKCSSAPGATINGGNKSGADPTDQITCQTICVASNDTNNPLPINSEML
ncbi:unnamed protein product [Oppiella nova]|uniref:Uncharacterized protein n=1 Tax=Oppiella nova TaxID=334625 RepID=A0A7R9LHB6_9ACAR|nr:unnamed protein product [Oppiella nova]CAG2163681.1 unnamed protein product [Oppiella nova]